MSEHTALPWKWTGNGKDIRLVSVTSMLPTVMDFTRVGMNGAGPRFAENGIMYSALKWAVRPESHNPWKITGVNHPDAEYIVRACNLLPELIGLLTQDITGGEHICVCCRRITKDGEDEKHLSRCPVPTVLAKSKAAES